MSMRHLGLLLVVALPFVTQAPTAASDEFDHLDPGGPPNLREEVPVQFVFLGYTQSQINVDAFRRQLPRRASPVVRSRLFYGVVEKIGLHYRYDYEFTFTDRAYEDRFFAALSRLADRAPRTLFQDLYNDQINNVVEVGQNHFIDAPTVEKWLIDNPPRGVNTRRNTVIFVNWWGRADFKFHVYTKFGEPDPDTGYDFGRNRHSRKIIAWGGTTPDDEETGLRSRGVHRLWFYDLSAGPESWSGSWNVDDADIDGDGSDDYRIPPIWEYLTPGGYRARRELSRDLGTVARFAAINLLFTPSPLYPPYITPERHPRSINLDLNTYEGWPGVNASEKYQKTKLLVDEVKEVHPIPYNADKEDLAFQGQALNCYEMWLQDIPCYPDRPQYPAFANLFLYNALNIEDAWDGGAEYEALFFNYATDDLLAAPFLGFADDNYVDGTQSFTFNFVSPGVAEAGYGLTTTQIHEYGHHFGMSHPHDGYDSELGIDYGPEGEHFYVWITDEVNSMMSYIDLNWDFSQFDRDNANRFQATAYILMANRIARDILRDPDARKAMADLKAADREIELAEEAIEDHDYPGAFRRAKSAYEFVRAGARKAGVVVRASQAGWTVLPPVAAAVRAAKRDYAYQDRLAPWAPPGVRALGPMRVRVPGTATHRTQP